MKKCIDCGWQGEIETDSKPEEREGFALYCPCCGRQTLHDGNSDPV